MSKLTVVFPEVYTKILEALSDREHVDKMEILKRAIIAYQEIRNATQSGQKVFIEDSVLMTRTEVIFP